MRAIGWPIRGRRSWVKSLNDMPDFLQVCEDANGVYDDSGSIEGYMFKKRGGTHKACAASNLTCLIKIHKVSGAA